MDAPYARLKVNKMGIPLVGRIPITDHTPLYVDSQKQNN